MTEAYDHYEKRRQAEDWLLRCEFTSHQFRAAKEYITDRIFADDATPSELTAIQEIIAKVRERIKNDEGLPVQ